MVSIDVLPDDVLLEILNICVDQDQRHRLSYVKKELQAWQKLVHVCRRWRTVVFGSPLHLNLALVCTHETPARDKLDVWPPFPLVIRSSAFQINRMDNIIAALERRDRVHQIDLTNLSNSRLEELLAAAQEPFPELTYLKLSLHGGLVIPDSFLGGSALRLQEIYLDGISFPGLPKLLLSATRLVNPRLLNIPDSAYIPPDAMVNMLSTLTCLGSLILEF